MASVLQSWVETLGLRHQGALLTAIRGCDGISKEDPSKPFIRCYRGVILNAHCKDARKARTFIEEVPGFMLDERFAAFRRSTDQYPHHWLLHVVHAIEIVGYKHPDGEVRQRWRGYYESLCRSMHVNPESEHQLDARLNAGEDTFAARDHAWSCDGAVKALDGVP